MNRNIMRELDMRYKREYEGVRVRDQNMSARDGGKESEREKWWK